MVRVNRSDECAIIFFLLDNAMSSPTKEAGGKVGGGGTLAGTRLPNIGANPVDGDKIWRDRIRIELQQQRQWKDEFGFMIQRANIDRSLSGSASDAGSSRAAGGSPTASIAATHAAAMLSRAEVEDMTAKLQRAQYTSTMRASFDRGGVAKSLELGEGKVSHRRRKMRI